MKRAILISILLAAPAVAQAPSGGGDSAGGGTNMTAAPVTGEQVYQQVCQACHMADAKGAKGAGIYPSLAANPKLTVAAYPIRVVIKGQKGMPPFGAYFDDAQVAAVVDYVRTHFDNHDAGEVTAQDVHAQR